VVEHENIQLK